MNSLRNSVRLIGNLGGSPEIKELPSGRKLAKVSLATTERYKDSDGKLVSETQWHNLIGWGKVAEYMIKHLDKGHEVAVQGKLHSRSYTDKDGNKRYISEINIDELMRTGVRKEKFEQE
jgi:single-strand DNA-binding protein